MMRLGITTQMARNPYPSELADRFQVRMPEGLRDRIAKAAEANNRSMNAEIVAALEVAYPPEPTIQELIYKANLLISDYGKTLDSDLMPELSDALKNVVESMAAVVRRVNTNPEMEALKGNLIAKDQGLPEASDLVEAAKKSRGKFKD